MGSARRGVVPEQHQAVLLQHRVAAHARPRRDAAVAVGDLDHGAVAGEAPPVVRALQVRAAHRAATQVCAHVRAVRIHDVRGATVVPEHDQLPLDRDERLHLAHLEGRGRGRCVPAVGHRGRLGSVDQFVAELFGSRSVDAVRSAMRRWCCAGRTMLHARVGRARLVVRAGRLVSCLGHRAPPGAAGGRRGAPRSPGQREPPIVSAKGQNASGSSGPTASDGPAGVPGRHQFGAGGPAHRQQRGVRVPDAVAQDQLAVEQFGVGAHPRRGHLHDLRWQVVALATADGSAHLDPPLVVGHLDAVRLDRAGRPTPVAHEGGALVGGSGVDLVAEPEVLHGARELRLSVGLLAHEDRRTPGRCRCPRQ